MRVLQVDRVGLERDKNLAKMYMLSPYVWDESGLFRILARGVPHARVAARKISSVFYGTGSHGTHFTMRREPVLSPDTELDSGGCEDPTVCRLDDGYRIFYSGWNEEAHDGSLLLASGRALDTLTKRGKVLPPNPHFQKCKEATVVRKPDGMWLMFFEYSHDNRSQVGLVSAPSIDGPWSYEPMLFDCRANHWDSWHLSTGPVVLDRDTPVMFYNGANEAGHWRVGWIRFDAAYAKVIDRCDGPLFIPPAPSGGFRDVAFAASAITREDECWLYYSVADAEVFRARVDLYAVGA